MTTKESSNPLEWLAKMMFWFIAVPFFGFLGYYTQVRPYFILEHGEYWCGFVDGIVSTLSALVMAVYIASKIPRKTARTQEGEAAIEKKEILYEETFLLSPESESFFDFELRKGQNLEGEISSNRPIDIHLLDSMNFEKWDKEKTFYTEYSTFSVLEAKINYIASKKGVWYVLIENSGKRRSATVKVYLYISGSD